MARLNKKIMAVAVAVVFVCWLLFGRMSVKLRF